MEKLVTWNEAFDFKGIAYRIVKEIDSNNMFSLYLLEDGRELRMTRNVLLYNFAKDKLLGKDFKNIAKVFDCFEKDFIDERNQPYKEYYVVSEHLDRSFEKHDKIQQGINLFRNTWHEYFHCLDVHLEEHINNAYVNNNIEAQEIIRNNIKAKAKDNIEEAIALAFDNVYRTIKGLDPHIKIHPYPANVGLADSMIKVCNFG